MPSEEEDLDEAYSRYSKRLKAKMAAQDPEKSEELRARIERVARQAPSKSELFATSDMRLKTLKEEFQIEVQTPQTLQEYVIYLLAQGQISESSSPTVAVADLYSEIHEAKQYKTLSRKDFQKTLNQLQKEKAIQLKDIRGTLVIKLRDEFLSEDEATILDIAARKAGKVSKEQVMLSTGWTQVRAQIALDALIAKNLVVAKKSFTRGTRYQIPNDT